MVFSRHRQRTGREFLKGYSVHELDEEVPSDQARGIPRPPLQREARPGQRLVDLPAPSAGVVRKSSIFDCIHDRKSHRSFRKEPLTLAELGYLLWATQGVRERAGNGVVLRTVPSAGNRHPLDTWLVIFNVEGIPAGIYRYLPLEHQLAFEREVPNLAHALSEACCGQRFVSEGAVTFVWTAIPYRTEWRYQGMQHKAILEDAGHVCQNLYLACESIGCGTCAIGAYVQEECDSLLGVDGRDEFTLYIAPVGHVS